MNPREVAIAYAAGASAREVAQRFGLSVAGVMKIVRREGVAVRPVGRHTSPTLSHVGDPALKLIFYDQLVSGGLQVFEVDPERHHFDRRLSAGASSVDARLALHQHQARQAVRTLYLWPDEIARPAIKSTIQYHLRALPAFDARKCELVEVDKQEEQLFYDRWHIQGAPRSTLKCLGLRHEGELVACMSFNLPHVCRGSNDGQWLLQRFAAAGSVRGGASRLLTNFRRGAPGAIISYSDNRYSTQGALYRQLGFELVSEVEADYRYWRDGRWWAKNTKQRQHLEHELEGAFADDDTEYTMASRLGYRRCYDCGRRTWLLK